MRFGRVGTSSIERYQPVFSFGTCRTFCREGVAMDSSQQQFFSRRQFCLCCVTSAALTATGGWLDPRQAYAEARNIVDLIRDDAAKAPIKVHKLRGNVSILE